MGRESEGRERRGGEGEEGKGRGKGTEGTPNGWLTPPIFQILKKTLLNAVKRAVIRLMLLGEIESQDHPKTGYCRFQFSYKTSRHSEIRSDSENPKQICPIAMLALLPIHIW